MSVLTLDPEGIINALTMLSQRIRRRFPEAQLNVACERALSIGRRAKRRAAAITRPLISLRLAVCVLVLALLAAPVWVAVVFDVPRGAIDLFSLVELIDSAARDVALVAVAVFFLITLETRIKRARVLRAIRELRNIAHIIDMHQLSKDPDKVAPAPESPGLTRYQMSRYLEYCNELLSLTGKIAAVYVQEFDDPVAVQAVNEIENLTAGLSQKILQKILILHTDETFGDTATHLIVDEALGKSVDAA